MKRTLRIPALLLALILVLTLAGCGKKNDPTGTWKYTIDFKQMIERSGEAEPETTEDMSPEEIASQKALTEKIAAVFDGVTMKMVMDLKADKTYTVTMDEADAKAAAETIAVRMQQVLPEILALMFGVGPEDLDTFLTAMGTNREEMAANMGDMFSTDELLNDLKEDVSEGTWRAEDGKLFMTEKGEKENSEHYLKYEQSGNELKITEVVGDEEDEFGNMKDFLPLVFTR